MPNLPENIIDRLAAMERRIQQLSTAVNTAPPLTMLPPLDTDVARWPQTTATSWTMISQSDNPIWQPKMRLKMYTVVSSGSTGQVRVMIDGVQWGTTVSAGTTFDATSLIATGFNSVFGTVKTFEIHAQVTSGTGSVYAQVQAMYGTPT